VTTSNGRTIGWGGNGGSIYVLFDANSSSPASFTSPLMRKPATNVFLGFAGGRGGHVHHLAALSVLSLRCSNSKQALAPAAPSQRLLLPPAWVVRAVYGNHARPSIRSAVASLASAAEAAAASETCATSPQGSTSSGPLATAEVAVNADVAMTNTVAAVRAAGRYASNLAKKGFGPEADARVTSVRVSNSFCDAKVTQC